ncbi:DUF4124 domain-containing protein [Variovorax dokdonensis]|uniref:DUF4124 domain-containing protein n=1 Tax=Variovorax dokdonensis TaxID=344883 RepID=A0ABT7NAZ2_9BURK|nr:DUF4124 domain-containing protein [Variovorax dokdonensis]MDM0045109.1 DUF4124 domain-containing protein [Variovorax dokdonensis]
MHSSWISPVVVVVLALLGSAPVAMAEVLRCIDGAGKVAYTDGKCPAGSRVDRPVTTQSAVEVLPDPAADAAARREAARSVAEDERLAARQAEAARAAPAGPVVIDGRGNPSAAATTREQERAEEAERWSRQTGDPLVVEESWGGAYPYPYAGGGRPPPPPRDQRPRIRGCDATGCHDTRGNTYNRQGQLDRYQSLDNKTCRPVGTTVVCR